jgi:DNA-binding response OmpR family regulator
VIGPATALIAGEDIDGASPDDVSRWVRIYSELVTLYDDLLERAGADPASQTKAGVLVTLRARARQRLAGWQERYRELVGIELDMNVPRLTYGGRAVPLTPRESQLLGFLLQHPGRRYKASALAGMAWGDYRLCSEQIRTYVARLRRELRAVGSPLGISCDRRDGYALTPVSPGA